MEAPLTRRLKELEDENRRLKKMHAEEKLKCEIAKEAIEKRGEAISARGDGGTCKNTAQHKYQNRMRSI